MQVTLDPGYRTLAIEACRPDRKALKARRFAASVPPGRGETAWKRSLNAARPNCAERPVRGTTGMAAWPRRRGGRPGRRFLGLLRTGTVKPRLVRDEPG